MKTANVARLCLFVLKTGVFPAAFYFLAFSLLTYPLITKFGTHLYADSGDGLQNVWNIWWVDHTVTELHQSPWHTVYLRHPYGVSLLGHTLTAFNGFLCLPFLELNLLTLEQAHNAAMVFAFVVGGMTAFGLAYRLSHSYGPSILAGYVFTFSNFHFAHAEGHLNFVSLEWIPLFVLLWYVFLLQPRLLTAFASAVVLFLVLLCEYNYYFYCLLIGVILFGW